MLPMRRRPLLRAAAIGGGSYRASKREMQRRKDLHRLARLHDQGVLTDAEYAEQRARLLAA
jgi:hypothetical protein